MKKDCRRSAKFLRAQKYAGPGGLIFRKGGLHRTPPLEIASDPDDVGRTGNLVEPITRHRFAGRKITVEIIGSTDLFSQIPLETVDQSAQQAIECHRRLSAEQSFDPAAGPAIQGR